MDTFVTTLFAFRDDPSPSDELIVDIVHQWRGQIFLVDGHSLPHVLKYGVIVPCASLLPGAPSVRADHCRFGTRLVDALFGENMWSTSDFGAKEHTERLAQLVRDGIQAWELKMDKVPTVGRSPELLTTYKRQVAALLDVVKSHLHIFGAMVSMRNDTGAHQFSQKRRRLEESVQNGPGEQSAECRKFELYQLINEMMKTRGYQRYGDVVMAPVCTQEGVATNCFRMHPEQSIDRVVLSFCDLNKNKDLLKDLISSGYLRQYCDMIKLKDEPEHFPVYKPTRYIFAGETGAYCCKTNQFLQYPLEDGVQPITYYEGIDFSFRNNYRENQFLNIPTPAMDKIIGYQLFEDPDGVPTVQEANVYMWYLALIGRLFFDVGDRDEWQVMLFLFGQAGTGKSVIINLFSAFYGVEGTGMIDEGMNEQFGLAPLLDKQLCLATDIGQNLKLKVAIYNNMVSGEPIMVDIKHNSPRGMPKWKSQLVLAGNVLPPWPDNSGALKRRAVFLHFWRIVKPEDQDQTVSSKIRAEIGHIIVKCALAYQHVRDLVGTDGFHKKVPREIVETSDKILASKQSLHTFVSSTAVLCNPRLKCPFEEFCTAYNAFCRTKRIIAMSTIEPSFTETLRGMSLVYVLEESEEWVDGGMMKVRDPFIKGCALRITDAGVSTSSMFLV